MNPVLFATYHPYEDSGFWEGYASVHVHVKRFSGSIRRKTLNWINNVYSSSPLHRHHLLPVSYVIEIYCIVSDGMTDRHNHHHHHHHHHLSVMELGHLLTRSGLTWPEVSSKVCHDSFCQLGNSVSLLWLICYEVAFCLHVVSSSSCVPVICLELVLFLIPL